ncbi:hypothetical protein L7F22_045178 [Adiantum nelumboides]|nr:hypothetical protein [Adiantum nelumboides]
MRREGIFPNEVTFLCILKACAAIGAIEKGKKIHDQVLMQGLLEHHVVLVNALVDMYAKCNALHLAKSVLEKLPSCNVVSWNALIGGYAQNGQGQQALNYLESMQCEGIVPDEITCVFILKGCALIGAISKGKQIHDEISTQGLLEHHPTLGSALVEMSAKCGSLHQTQIVLEKLPSWDVICWNVLLASYTENGQGKAPFEVIEGRPKGPLLLKVHGKIFTADEYSRDLKESFQKIKEAISISQQKQKAAGNKHKRALAFKENDWVFLKFPKACLRHTLGKNPTGHQKYYAKLAKGYYGPFKIVKPINEMAYQLKLPNHWLIHNAFHVSILKSYKGEPPSEAIMEDPPEVEDQEEVLQLESILRHEDKVLRHDSSPPSKPPYRVSQAQQEEIMRKVNELVEKGMVVALTGEDEAQAAED